MGVLTWCCGRALWWFLVKSPWGLSVFSWCMWRQALHWRPSFISMALIGSWFDIASSCLPCNYLGSCPHNRRLYFIRGMNLIGITWLTVTPLATYKYQSSPFHFPFISSGNWGECSDRILILWKSGSMAASTASVVTNSGVRDRPIVEILYMRVLSVILVINTLKHFFFVLNETMLLPRWLSVPC